MSKRICPTPHSARKTTVVKRPYVPPKLEEYGKLSSLTQGGLTGTPDGAPGRSQKTFFGPDDEPESE